MATYLILNSLFMTAVFVAFKIKQRWPRRALLLTAVVLFVLTAVFDNIIIGLSIVDYDPAKILGVRIGVAPIEDFMYALFAVVIVPAIWSKLRVKDDNENN